VFNTNANNSPRGDEKSILVHNTIDASQLSSIPSVRRLEGVQTYKQQTCNRAFYMWNQWNARDENILHSTKTRIRDKFQMLREEYRIQKYQQELLSIQKKRNLIETY
jgi:hypothetical protein